MKRQTKEFLDVVGAVCSVMALVITLVMPMAWSIRLVLVAFGAVVILAGVIRFGWRRLFKSVFVDRKIFLSETLVMKVQESWLDSVLTPTLDEGIDISPSMTLVRKGGNEDLARQFSPANIFNGNRCRLLITGEGGSGKTIQLLKFVKDLMPRGANINRQAIPIVLPAATWVNKPHRPPEEQQSIREWINSQFLVQWGLTKTLSAELIEGPQRIIYCIDGYDEIGRTIPIGESPVAACEALEIDPHKKDLIFSESEDNGLGLRLHFFALLQEFIFDGAGEQAKGFLISSRTKYAVELHALAELGFTELQIHSLTEHDISMCLKSNNLTCLKRLSTRPEVLERLTNPLHLQMFATVYPNTLSNQEIKRYQEDAEDDFQKFMDSTYKAFYDKKLAALEYARKTNGYSLQRAFSSKDIHDFTRKIARYLANRRLQAFRLDRLQPSELPFQLLTTYRTINGIFFLVAVFLLIGIPIGIAAASGHWIKQSIASGIRAGLLTTFGIAIVGGMFVAVGYRFLHGFWLGFIIGLGFAVGRIITVSQSEILNNRQEIASLLAVPFFAWLLHHTHEDPMQIVPVEIWETNRRRAAAIAIGIAVLLGVIAGLLLGKERGISVAFGLAIFMGTRFSKQERSAPIQVRPNQSIKFSLQEACRHAVGITLLCVVIFIAAYSDFRDYKRGLLGGAHALTFLFAFFFFGGIPVLKHYALRFVLWRAKLLPWRAVQFLTTVVQTGLMRQVGGGFQFSHPEFQSYFARRVCSETWGITDHGDIS